MTSGEDWRLSFQSEHLHGATLIRKVWVQTRPDWDHDHCAFCWAKFGPPSQPDMLHEGYATSDEYDWVCPTCFEDFRERFGWQQDSTDAASQDG